MSENLSICGCLICELHARQPDAANQLLAGLNEAGRKFAIEMLLADRSCRILVPTQDEWIGLNEKDRDGEVMRCSR